MKIFIIKIDKPARREYDGLVDVYRKRLRSADPIQEIFLSSRSGEKQTEEKVRERLGRLENPYLVALDERGKQWTSPDLAKKVKGWQENPQIRNLVFLVGGPYGLSAALRETCRETWALASGVYPSDLAWLMVWEQLYRAYSINSGSSYHHA